MRVVNQAMKYLIAVALAALAGAGCSSSTTSRRAYLRCECCQTDRRDWLRRAVPVALTPG